MLRLFVLLPGLLKGVAKRVSSPALLCEEQGEGKEKRQKNAGRLHGGAHLNKDRRGGQPIMGIALQTYSLSSLSASVNVHVRVMLRISVSRRMSGGSGE